MGGGCWWVVVCSQLIIYMFRLLQSWRAKKFSHHQQPESMRACSISCKNLISNPIFSPFRARANGATFKLSKRMILELGLLCM